MAEISFAFFDEDAKKEIRRAILKGISLPGYIVPFASREMPVARGWGTGGLQLTLTIICERDTIKVIDQGCDGSVNAVNIREFIVATTGVASTTKTREASLIQTRHRLPELPVTENQVLIFQVPTPDVLTTVEPDTDRQKKMHAHREYSKLWVLLYEDTARFGDSRLASRYPVEINGHYIMDPSPIPRYDIPRLGCNPALMLFGAGREKRIYAIPPYTKVKPIIFNDRSFQVEDLSGLRCSRCGAENVFLDMVEDGGVTRYYCSDSDFCEEMSGDMKNNAS